MSHFTVLVVGENVEELLQPFHEYECTGVKDEYVTKINKLDELKQNYENEELKVHKRLSDGKVFSKYEPQFYRVPTEEEQKKLGFGSGTSDGLFYESKDWGDGKGYSQRVRFVPEGFIEEEIKGHSALRTLYEYITEYCGYESVTSESDGEYSCVLVDEEKNVLDAWVYTNPNSKWDWYQEGGRWSDKLVNIEGKKGNSFKKGEVDFDKSFFYYDEEKKTMLPTPTFALLNHDGWHEKGQMGWWGIVANEKESENWYRQFKELWDEIENDQLVTVVDCHI